MKKLSEVLAIVVIGAVVIGGLAVFMIFVNTLAGKVMPQPDVPGAAVVVWVVETFRFQQAAALIDDAARSGVMMALIVFGFAAFHLRRVLRAMLPWVLILGAVAATTVTLTAGQDVSANLTFCALVLLGGLFLLPQKNPQYQYRR